MALTKPPSSNFAILHPQETSAELLMIIWQQFTLYHAFGLSYKAILNSTANFKLCLPSQCSHHPTLCLCLCYDDDDTTTRVAQR